MRKVIKAILAYSAVLLLTGPIEFSQDGLRGFAGDAGLCLVLFVFGFIGLSFTVPGEEPNFDDRIVRGAANALCLVLLGQLGDALRVPIPFFYPFQLGLFVGLIRVTARTRWRLVLYAQGSGPTPEAA